MKGEGIAITVVLATILWGLSGFFTYLDSAKEKGVDFAFEGQMINITKELMVKKASDNDFRAYAMEEYTIDEDNYITIDTSYNNYTLTAFSYNNELETFTCQKVLNYKKGKIQSC